MRTLKKTLCLVLCLAMMVGLCAIGASAAFADEDKIENKEAAAVLNGIGVLTGREDGSFDPTATLTRAEACAIIARLLGNDTYMAKKETVFTDVPASNFYSGYIAFCYGKGIVAGTGNNLFKPNEKLTAAAWAKMLLCALGYDAESEGLVGSTWDLNTAVLVSRTKLADGMSFDPDAEITRDQAALLAFNALTVPMVEYKGFVKVTTPDTTVVEVAPDRAPTGEFLADNFGLVVYPYPSDDFKKHELYDEYIETGIVTANAYNSVDGEWTILNDYYEYEYETGEDLLGRYVKVYLNEDEEVVAIVEIGSSKRVDTAIKAEDSKGQKAALGAKNVGAMDVVLFDEGDVDTDGEIDTTADGVATGTYVFNDEGNLVAVVLDSYVCYALDSVKKIDTKEDAEAIELTGIGALQNNETTDEVREYDGIAKGDIVLVEQVGEVITLTKAETVTGKITKKTSTNVLTLDGKTYKQAKGVEVAEVITDPVAPADLTAEVLKEGNEYTLYLDKNGNYVVIAAAEEAAAPLPDVYYFLGITSSDTMKDNKVVYAIYATVVDAAGTKTTNTLLASFSSTTERDAAKGDYADFADKLVTLTPNKKTGGTNVAEFDQEATKTANLGSGLLDEEDVATLNGKTNKLDAYYVNADTTFVFISDDGKNTVEVKTGLISISSEAAADAPFIYTLDKNGNSVLKTVYIHNGYEAAAPSSTDPAAVYYIDANVKPTTYAGYYTYTVYSAATGEKVEIKVDKESKLTDELGLYNSFVTDKDGYTTLTPIEEGAKANYGKVYAGRYENSIRIEEDGADLDASKAVIVDLTTDGGIASIDDLAKAKDDVVFDILYSKTAVIATIVVMDAPEA